MCPGFQIYRTLFHKFDLNRFDKKGLSETLEDKLKYIRKGIPEEYFQEYLNFDIKKAFLNGVNLLDKESLKSDVAYTLEKNIKK